MCSAEERAPGSLLSTLVSKQFYPDNYGGVVVRTCHMVRGKVGHEHSITDYATESGNGTLSASPNGPSGTTVSCSLLEAPWKMYGIMFVPTKTGMHALDVRAFLWHSSP